MTRTEKETQQAAYSPRRLKLDKENVRRSSPKNRPQKTPYKSPFRPSPSMQKTPPGSSKLLREHFGHMSLGSTRRRRLMDAGPVRLLHPTGIIKTGPVRILNPTPRRPKAIKTLTPTSIQRVGIDGTHYTPSRELLQSTAASRNNRFIPFDEEASASTTTDHSIASFVDWESPRKTPPRRLDCMDPVAFTLLRGGEEDPAWLIEQDRSYRVPKVSTNLRDVYGDKEMARPVPMVARRQL